MIEVTGQPTPPADAGTTAAPGTGTVEPPVVTAPEGFVKPDGTFVEGWQGRLTTESLRTDETLKRFSNFDDLANSYVNVRKQVPLDKVVIPTETSPPEVWDEFHKAGGRPDTKEEYAIVKPAELPDEHWDKELATTAQALFHKIGLSKAQAKELTEFDNLRLTNGLKQMAEAEERETAEAEKVINDLSGIDKDARLHDANRMIAENYPDGENKVKLLEAINTNKLKPYILDFLANIATKFQESGIVHPTTMPSKTVTDIGTKINELRARPGYTDKMHPDHKFILGEIDRLYQEKSRILSQPA